MASDHQFALTRTRRLSSANNISKSTRQVVPQFLQKVYEMLNDPANSHLIRWSDAGDSFYVLDHERFARELLGRWFKHQNFNTFVRQLNMYGFHKIPHLQQGVLKGEPDTEYWHYEHPNFQRGQPDLLCLIQRKKPTNTTGEDTAIDFRTPTNVTPASSIPAASLSPGQMLDIHTIINGITAIKRHQQTISSELNELKNSNQLLWQDALAARARHQKHQDTINRILRFLAGVFGHQAGSPVRHDDDASHRQSSPGRSVVPRKPHRLMIEQGPQTGKGMKSSAKVDLTEIEDEETPQITTPRRQSNEFDITSPTSLRAPSPAPSTDTSLLPMPSDSIPPSTAPSTPGIQLDSSSPEYSSTSYTTLPASGSIQSSQPLSDDAARQAAIAQLLNQPGQLQKLLAALASQPLPDPTPLPPQSSSQLTSYDPHFDFSRAFSSSDNQPYTTLPLISSPSPPPVVQNIDRLENTWKANEDIDKDVDHLQNSISSLIETLGLDPTIMESADNATTNGSTQLPQSSTTNLPDVISSSDEPNTQPDFDFDAFFNVFSTNPDQATDASFVDDEASQAFLDEVSSPSDSLASPVSAANPLPKIAEESSPEKSRKRKSDVAGLDNGVSGGILATNGASPEQGAAVNTKRKK